jgi:hypothetical protein
MLNAVRFIFLSPQQNNSLVAYPDFLRSFQRRLQKLFRRHQRMRTRVLELIRQFIRGIRGVCWRDNSTGEEGAVDDGRDVDVVWRVKGEYFIFLPIPQGAQSFAE